MLYDSILDSVPREAAAMGLLLGGHAIEGVFGDTRANVTNAVCVFWSKLGVAQLFLHFLFVEREKCFFVKVTFIGGFMKKGHVEVHAIVRRNERRIKDGRRPKRS